MTKTAILGGSFNPIHNGHLHVAKVLKELSGVQKVLLIPTCLPPHKSAEHLAPGEDRLQMCRLAVEGLPGYSVSAMELAAGGASYTVNTLRRLKQERPGEELYFFCGADMFLTFDQWYRWQEILTLCVLCAVPRPGGDFHSLQTKSAEYQAAGGRILLAEVPELPLSSTEIRRLIHLGRPIDALVPKKVAEYIQTRGLYR